jgi:hypothetical protein
LTPTDEVTTSFVSYSHEDGEDVCLVVEELQQLRPGLQVFFDRMTLDHGSAWQQEVFEVIDASRRFLAMFSPSYLASKILLEGFNIALHRRLRELRGACRKLVS